MGITLNKTVSFAYLTTTHKKINLHELFEYHVRETFGDEDLEDIEFLISMWKTDDAPHLRLYQVVIESPGYKENTESNDLWEYVLLQITERLEKLGIGYLTSTKPE